MYQIENPYNEQKVLHIKYCDKQGTSVLKRLASMSNQISSTLILGDSTMPRIHKNYIQQCADKIVTLYKQFNPQQTFQNVVFGSPHQTGLYIAELMNVPFLPLQFIGFAQTLLQTQQLKCLKIVGCDYDYTNLCWLWCKIGQVKHIPSAYLRILQNAKNVIIVRGTDKFCLKKVDSCIGKLNDQTYVHSSIKLWKQSPQYMNLYLQQPTEECENIRQWQFGLPDKTITCLKQVWQKFHPNNIQNLQIIQLPTVQLYKFIPNLFIQHYKATKTQIKGISLNPYYTLHPYYQKSQRLVPFVYYNFAVLQKYFKQTLELIKQSNNPGLEVKEQNFICFANLVEKQKDLSVIKKFWAEYGLQKGWFSIGFDCVLANKNKKLKCVDIYGQDVPAPYQKIKQWTLKQYNKIENVPLLKIQQLKQYWKHFVNQLHLKKKL